MKRLASRFTRRVAAKRALPFALVAFMASTHAGAQIIYTIAGTGTAGYSGDNMPALQAELNGPTDVIYDAQGNYYIADRGNHCVRKVDAGGIITTVIGTGTAGYNGDGAGAATQLSAPSGLGMTASGDLLIADTGNSCIREWSPTTLNVTTVAGTCTVSGFGGNGGPATSALLYAPWDVAGGPNGEIYISDTGNLQVRSVVPNGKIYTIAGDQNATIQCATNLSPFTSATSVILTPLGISVDSANNVYISTELCGALLSVNGGGGLVKVVNATTSNLAILLNAVPVPGGNFYASSAPIGGLVWKLSYTSASHFAGTGFAGPSPPDGTPALSTTATLDFGTPDGGGLALGPSGAVCFTESNRIRCVGVAPPAPESLGCVSMPCAGTYWISVPTTTSLVTAEDLCNAIGPPAQSVTQWFPKDNGTFGSYTWDCVNHVCSPSNGGAACSSQCFCIDDGEGYSVTTNGPALLPLLGHDDPVSITLPAGGHQYLISPPIISNISTTIDLAASLALPFGTTLTTIDGCSGTQTTWQVGNVLPIALAKGDAVLLNLPGTGGLTYTNPTSGASGGTTCAVSNGNEYCIAGDSSGGSYSWGLDLNNNGMLDGTDPIVTGVTGIPAGYGSDSLAAAFASSINFNQNNVVATYPGSTSNCFVLSTMKPLYVGPSAGPPSCLVTASGCTYNPVITLGPSKPPDDIPALQEIGLVVLAILILVAGSLVLARRRVSSGHI